MCKLITKNIKVLELAKASQYSLKHLETSMKAKGKNILDFKSRQILKKRKRQQGFDKVVELIY